MHFGSGGDSVKERLLRHKPLLVFFAVYTLIFVLLVQVAAYIMPAVIALIIAVVMKPLYDFFRRHFRFQPAFTATVITLLVYGALLLITGYLLYLVAMQAVSLYRSYGYLIEDYFNSPEAADSLSAALVNGDLLSTVSDIASSVFRVVPLILTFVIFTFVLTIFFLNHLHRIRSAVLERVGEKHRETAARVISTAYLLTRRFIRSYLILYFITFVEAVFIFWLTGVDYPLAFAFITAVADVLPVLGPGTVLVPFGIVFILQQNYIPGVTILVFFLLTSILREVLEPKIVSDTVKVHPLAVMAAIYCSIVAMNIWILFYVLLLFLSYKTLVLSGVLPDRKHTDGGEEADPQTATKT